MQTQNMRTSKLLSLLRENDPAGVGVFPEYEKDFVEYAAEALACSDKSGAELLDALIEVITTNYGRNLDAFMRSRLAIVVQGMQ